LNKSNLCRINAHDAPVSVDNSVSLRDTMFLPESLCIALSPVKESVVHIHE